MVARKVPNNAGKKEKTAMLAREERERLLNRLEEYAAYGASDLDVESSHAVFTLIGHLFDLLEQIYAQILRR